MSQPTISIIGAGICGLTLGRCLLQRGVRAILYEKAPARPRNHYAITLQPSSYRPLLKALNIDETTFNSRVAVDAESGGAGAITTKAYGYRNLEPSSFRANRSAFEALLREGLDVRWEHALQDVEEAANGAGFTLKFANGTTATSDVVVDAEGPHSVIRVTFLPSIEPRILPYVAFNGKRKVSKDDFDTLYAELFAGGTVVQERQDRGVVLNLSIGSASSRDVSLNWIYSRPARGDDDALHNPGRSQAAAKSIPEEFFSEVAALSGGLSPGFRDVFDAERLRGERILHWLMRSVVVPQSELVSLAGRGVSLVGDAAHAEQIIGGGGANEAIEDGVSLADWIAEKGTGEIAKWYATRYPSWQEGQRASRECIAGIHGETEIEAKPTASLM
ncbi:hypothetical protein E8E13_002560 [Curvularia kusanoi]|uniref:FAD-binding domain-containing protein n=1 Tax=Curvularia kusanoi TaxID=90978 RepID=A0A9P4W206_CURKU|nr:hypothetical protein E8E13_002560 [Curvularia kusanoi]